jgi:ferritin
MLKPSERLTEAFTQQIGNELAASLQYIAIANYFITETLPELAKFYYVQADEERGHAMKFVNFLLDVGAPVDLPAVPAPQCRFASAEEAVALSLRSEQDVTGQIYGLVDLAREERHYAALRLLDWFIVEQQEEESTASSLLQVVHRAGESGLLLVEDYLVRKAGVPNLRRQTT